MRVADFSAVLVACTVGALCAWWTDSLLVGIPAALLLTWLYGRFLRARLEERVTRRQRAYDSTPDGRLTRNH